MRVDWLLGYFRAIMTYYIKNSFVPVDENQHWEFKGHRNFSADEIPAWRPDGSKVCPIRNPKEFAKLTNGVHRTRQPISRNINGFLNSGKHGNILIGVLDNGKVEGIPMNSMQKDHLLVNLEDCLRRFQPSVPRELVKVAFIPVVSSVEELLNYDPEQAKICEPPDAIRFQPHLLRTSSLCWCEVYSMERQRKFGFIPQLYVIEIRIAALHPSMRTPEVNKALTSLIPASASPFERLSWPAFINEDHSAFVRVFASVVKYTHLEIEKFNRIQTQMYIKDLLKLEQDSEEWEKETQKLLVLLEDPTVDLIALLNEMVKVQEKPIYSTNPIYSH
ncbi:uncharacterized protein LOC132193277 isoform X2 [Neocloeon triangulifer]|uniref:uncharacterized protein LOC132193277 isoform X2 n=1 Tax=Neocloeon triangulifer TaxID=2078957 RepID=UPI00286EFF3D|nr:uncharacterized protein LOC132193277 isoform X2 [Neocloeon triangulifer]